MVYIKGGGLPTLLTKNAFTFHEKAIVDEKYKKLVESDIAVNVICTILKDKLKEKGVKNRLYFLNSRTGSGKSTTFIYNLYNHFIRNINTKIMVTEPRVPLCEANANEIVRWSDYGDKIGKNVGFLTGPAKVRCTEKNGQLYYCTPQILANCLNSFLSEKQIKESDYIRVVVIDEAHLLDMPTLETLNIIYNFLDMFGENPLCPLFIFASATLNLEPFLKYFLPLFKYDSIDKILEDCKLIGFVSGSANFTVNLKYTNNNDLHEGDKMTGANIKNPAKEKNTFILNYSNFIAQYIIKNYVNKMLAEKKENGNDLLLFVPKSSIINNSVIKLVEYLDKTTLEGEPVICYGIVKNTTFDAVVEWRNKNRRKPRILIIGYGRGFAPASDELLKTSLDPDEESRMFERKIFISTPIIETGKTISSLRYCIDSGLELKPCPVPLIYNPYRSMENLKMVPINQSAATQRLGRVGREQTGECQRFYTEENYNRLDKSELPETINNYCLSSVLLSKLQTMKPLSYYDIFNDNNYLYKISLDIHIRTVCDLINAGFYNIFGYITDRPFGIDRSTVLINYIQQLYYIMNFSLFDALLIININMKFLSNDLTPKGISVRDLPIQLRDIHKRKIDGEIAENIKKSRNVITLVLYDPSFTVFKHMYGRLF